ncbi:PIN domain-containing protein, partial [Fusobacterium polymorphum]
EWFSKIQNDKKQNILNWLRATTKIESINQLSANLYWKNIIRKVELVDGMKWKISGMDDQYIDEISLKKFVVPYTDELKNLPSIDIKNPDDEIKKLVSIDEINNLIGEFIKNDDLFCVEAKYYQDVK